LPAASEHLVEARLAPLRGVVDLDQEGRLRARSVAVAWVGAARTSFSRQAKLIPLISLSPAPSIPAFDFAQKDASGAAWY